MGNNFTPISRFQLDYETIGRLPEPIGIADTLLDRIADPKWSRDRVCWGCEHWKQSDGLGNLPHRPGVGVLCVEQCSGCHYSHLDQVSFTPTVSTQTLAAMAALREGWAGVMSVRKPRKPRPYVRALRWDSVADQQGYAGKRAKREPVQSSFTRANDPNERRDCPWCGVKGGAKIERYWSMKKGHDPVRVVIVQCLTCGGRDKREGEQ